MPSTHIIRQVEIERTPRVMQLEGLFDLPIDEGKRIEWDVHLPVEERNWNIGLIVGPSGSGKSTVARELFPEAIQKEHSWPTSQGVIDGFPSTLGIKDLTAMLSQIGFSSPPSWLRPYHVLSTGEKFRVDIARSLTETDALVVIDEFTSVVDRTVAQIGSAAVAKMIRRQNRQLIAVSCHYDIIDWLQPDWIYEPGVDSFAWRELQRHPSIELRIERVHRKAWRLFRDYHYLSRDCPMSAHCYVASYNEEPIAFCGVVAFPHPKNPGWRLARTVCRPDYQGVGIGNALANYIASVYAATGKQTFAVTGNPAMVHYRAKSQDWEMYRAPAVASFLQGPRSQFKGNRLAFATRRNTASFRWVGPRNHDAALAFGVIGATGTAPESKSRRTKARGTGSAGKRGARAGTLPG